MPVCICIYSISWSKSTNLWLTLQPRSLSKVRHSCWGCSPRYSSWRILPSTSRHLCCLLPAQRSKTIVNFMLLCMLMWVAYNQLFSLLEAQVLCRSCLVGIAGNEQLSKISTRRTGGYFRDRRERRVHTTSMQAAIVGVDGHSWWPLSLVLQRYSSSSAITLCGRLWLADFPVGRRSGTLNTPHDPPFFLTITVAKS